MSKKHQKVWTTLTYIKHFLVLGFLSSGCITILCLCFCNCNPYRNYKFYNRIKFCAIIAGIKKYNPIIKKKRKRQDKIVLLAKTIK